jgi:ATP-dependent DNA helicase RecG
MSLILTPCPKESPNLHRPLTCLKNIGPKRAEVLARKGIYTPLDLLCFMPLRYEDRSRFVTLEEAGNGESVLISGKVLSGGEQRFFRSGKRLFRIVIGQGSKRLELIWFHYKKPHLLGFCRSGLEVMVYGRLTRDRGRNRMIHPEISLLDSEASESVLGFYPVYPAVAGLSANFMRSLVKQALKDCGEFLLDPVPREVLRRLDLPELGAAVKEVHRPPREARLDLLNRFRTRAQQRLIFNGFFHFMLNVTLRRAFARKRPGPVFSVPRDFPARFEAAVS